MRKVQKVVHLSRFPMQPDLPFSACNGNEEDLLKILSQQFGCFLLSQTLFVDL
jgi:hypothetical protein